MIKIFSILKYTDRNWTGGGCGYVDGWLELLNVEINKWEEECNVVIDKIEHSSVNDNIQTGPYTTNTTRNIIHVATIYYRDRLSFSQKLKGLFLKEK